MIKFKATGKEGREVIGLGFSAGNLDRLLAGDPVLIRGEDWNTPFDILIFAAATEQALTDELTKHGVVGPETVVHDRRKAKRN